MFNKLKGDSQQIEWIVNCELCGETILRGQWFCSSCGPPKPEPKSLPKKISAIRAAIQILLLTTLFFSLSFYKLNQDLFEFNRSRNG